ncbi:MAG: DUF2461 domain-containing protein [Gemmatimonadota bacterium]
MTGACITPELFRFFEELAAHNDRGWFEANRTRYENAVRGPLLRFIADFEEPLDGISPYMVADPRRSGGSLFRIHRDTRFSRDKSPYKTSAGIQFRHEVGRNVHGPSFYLHLAPDLVFAGAGCWHPDGPALRRIREAIGDDPEAWTDVRARVDEAGLAFEGESLKRIPRGFDADHPLAGDLKRKDFVVTRTLDRETVCTEGFLDTFAAICRSASPLPAFLAGALELPW